MSGRKSYTLNTSHRINCVVQKWRYRWRILAHKLKNSHNHSTKYPGIVNLLFRNMQAPLLNLLPWKPWIERYHKRFITEVAILEMTNSSYYIFFLIYLFNFDYDRLSTFHKNVFYLVFLNLSLSLYCLFEHACLIPICFMPL